MNYREVFISGATSGLGKELCFLFADKKIPLFITARNHAELLLLQKELEKKTSVFSFPADLSSNEDLNGLIEEIKKRVPDLIINSAGLGLYGDVLSHSLEKQMNILKINVEALVRICIAAASSLKDLNRSGTIMNISSTAGNYIYPSFALYAASKGFVTDFSLSFDKELSAHGIRVLTSLPGRFISPFTDKASGLLNSSQKTSWDSISLKKTAALVLKQIQKKKGIEIIDFRYRILHFISLFIPRSWLATFLRRSILKKIHL